jgi:fructokinase
LTYRPDRPHSFRAEETTGVFRPLIFGEALHDHFPDGSKVLGGAPFNVAWHLQGFKAGPLMVTAVGEDSDGEEILERMAGWGMSTSGVQIHPTRPTGRVTARMEDGEPRYEIEARQAYDAISRESLPPPRELERVQMLYHGSLGIREERSRETLDHLRRTLQVPALLDVNLRDPWWNREVLVSRTRGADCVKVNREEAEILAGLPARGEAELLATARSLHSDLEIGTLVVTLGADGALAVRSDEVHRQEAPPLAEVVDPVGAGDAFSAVLALGMHERWAVETILRRATEFAAELCRVRGAILEDPDVYARHLRRWNHAA